MQDYAWVSRSLRLIRTGPVHDRRSEPDDELFHEIERRALMGLPAEEAEESIDVVGALAGGEAPPAPTEDATLGGYMRKHGRVPAFEGGDGQPYTVDIDVETQQDGTHVAFYIFLRWAATGAGIMDHVESGDIAHAASEDDARRLALERSLFEVRAELDAAIERRSRETA